MKTHSSPAQFTLAKGMSTLGLALLLFICLFSKKADAQKVDKYQMAQDFLFKENKGQLADEKGNLLTDIKYYGNSCGVNLYIRPSMISFVFTKTEKEPDQISEATGAALSPAAASPDKFGGGGRGGKGNEIPKPSKITTSRADLVLINANPSAHIVGTDQQAYYENYYLAHTPETGATNVHTYKTLTYKDIYPHIDMVLHTKEKGMKYEFVVNPGGEVRDIQIQWNGQNMVSEIDGEGGIKYKFGFGEIQESKPFTYQGKNEIKSRFEKTGNQIGFRVQEYNRAMPLVVDPGLSWGILLGGDKNSEIVGNSLTTDSFGNVYMTGYTTSTSGIATSGSYQSIIAGAFNGDAFLSKFDKDGKIIWSTYYGGNYEDRPFGITEDNIGGLYLTGCTFSSYGIATSGAHQTSLNGYVDGFLAKFNTKGMRIWATYYGGSEDDFGLGLCMGGAADIFITGQTRSSNGISTPGSNQSKLSGSLNAYLAKFDSSGSIQWATYYGDSTIGSGVVCDRSGNVFLTGWTIGSNKIATVGAYQTSFGGSRNDVFLAKFTPSGTRAWSTYFGGDCADYLNYYPKVATDHEDCVYLTSATCSKSGIATTGAYQTSLAGIYDIFLAKFNNNGILKWCTYFGGTATDDIGDMFVDSYNNIYITGLTQSTSGIATSGAFQTSLGSNGGFLAKFDKNGSRLWASYVAGEHTFELTLFNNNKAFICGYNYVGGSLYAFLNAYNLRVNNDAGVSTILSPKGKLCAGKQPVKLILKNFGFKELDSVKINLSINQQLLKPYYWMGKMKQDSEITITLDSFMFPPGVDTLKAWTSSPNGLKDSLFENDTAFIVDSIVSPSATYSATIKKCGGVNFTASISGSSLMGISSYTWSGNGAAGYGPLYQTGKLAIYQYTRGGTYPYTLTLVGNNGCKTYYNDSVKIAPFVSVSLPKDTALCGGSAGFTINASYSGGNKPYTFNWDNFPATGTSISPKITTDSVFVVRIKDGNGCTNYDSMHVKLLAKPAINAGTDKILCKGDSVQIGSGIPVSGIAYSWLSIPSSSLPFKMLAVVKPVQSTTYILTAQNLNSGCSASDTTIVTVDSLPTARFYMKDSIFCLKDSLVLHDTSKNAATWAWDFGDGNTATTTNPKHKYASGGKYKVVLTVMNANGCKDTFYRNIFVDTTCVWPGDANFNKTADIFDVLAIGLAYKDKGSPRADTTTQWYAHPAYDWSKSFKSGANHKHADCNGDGVVDTKDLKAITRNYGKTHLKASAAGSGNASDPLLSLVISKDSTSTKDTVIIDMQLGTQANPLKDIYGLGFSINYDPANTDITKGIKVDLSKCWLGTPGKDLIFLIHNDSLNGVFDIGISRNDQKAVSGYGSLGMLSIITPDNVAGKKEIRKELHFEISRLKAINTSEKDIPLYIVEDSILFYQFTSGMSNPDLDRRDIQLYPNPANTVLHIGSSGEMMKQVEIFNSVGERVILNKMSSTQHTDINVENLKSGIYLVEIYSETGRFTGRFVKQ